VVEHVLSFLEYKYKVLRERSFSLEGGVWFFSKGYGFFLKNVLISNVAEKSILILVEEKKII
jgi:hypothetical protein